MKCACGCKKELASLGGSCFREGRWWLRAHYNAAKVEMLEARYSPRFDQYKRDKMQMEIGGLE